MSFSERFQSYVCEGDAIDCEADGYTVTARIVRDDCPDAPDERHDGFWLQERRFLTVLLTVWEN